MSRLPWYVCRSLPSNRRITEWWPTHCAEAFDLLYAEYEHLRELIVRLCERAVHIEINFESEFPMPLTLAVGQTVIATATEYDAAGVVVPIIVTGLTWTSSATTVATVITNADGTATYTAVSAGTSVATVTDAANGLTTDYTFTVTAAADVATTIAITFGIPTTPGATATPATK